MTSKVIIVTGASRGLGAAVAKCLLQNSHKVVLAARSGDLLQEFENTYGELVKCLAGDITEPEIGHKLVETAVKTFGKLDGIVINHGMLNITRVANTSIQDFRLAYEVNVFSSLTLVQAALPELRKSKGCIVWVSTGAATSATASWVAYGSTKAALLSIASHVAIEENDVVSVSIAPGKVDTNMQEQIRSHGEAAMDRDAYDVFVNAHATGELLDPRQPGDVIAKVVANPAKDLTGKLLRWNATDLEGYQN